MKSQQPADRLLSLIKQCIDRSISGKSILNQFLNWVLQKSGSIQTNNRPAALRAFYFALDLTLVRALDRARAHALDLDRTLDHNCTLDLDRARTLDRTHALARTRDLDRDLARTLDLALALDHDRALDRALDRTRALDRAHDLALTLARALTCNLNSEFTAKLEQLRATLPSLENLQHFHQWWRVQGQQWLGNLRQVMIEHRNIGHDWQFNEQQKQQLQRYYDANRFLVNLMQIEGAVSQKVRAEIEDSLLLPWDELQRRYPKTYGNL